MIIYNKTDLLNYWVYSNASIPESASDDRNNSWKEFKSRFPYPFYSPSFFIRLGLFLLSSLMVLLVTALLYLIVGMPGGERSYGFLFLVMGALCFISSEYLARKRKHFQSGADESLHLCTALLAAFGAGGMLHLPGWAVASIAAIVAVLLFLRYMDFWMAGLAVLCCFIFLANCFMLFLPVFVYAIPLALLAIAGSYLIRFSIFRETNYYRTGLLVARYCFLLIACFFGNYLCVTAMYGNRFSPPSELEIYKITSVVLPLGILLYGILKKEKVSLHVGMLTILPAVYTVYTFLNASHPFLWLTICGGLLITISAAAIAWLKTERRGFIYRPVKKPESVAWMELIVAANAPRNPEAGDHTGYGGGDFGGGGASGSF